VKNPNNKPSVWDWLEKDDNNIVEDAEILEEVEFTTEELLKDMKGELEEVPVGDAVSSKRVPRKPPATTNPASSRVPRSTESSIDKKLITKILLYVAAFGVIYLIYCVYKKFKRKKLN